MGKYYDDSYLDSLERGEREERYYSKVTIPVNGFSDLDDDDKEYILCDLEEDTHVYLRNEFDNARDKHALIVMHHFNILGYIDDKYTETIHYYLRKNKIGAITVKSIKHMSAKKGHIKLNVYYEDKNGDEFLPYYPFENRQLSVLETDLWTGQEDWSEDWFQELHTEFLCYRFNELLQSQESKKDRITCDVSFMNFVRNYLAGLCITKDRSTSYEYSFMTDECKAAVRKRIESFMENNNYHFGNKELYDDDGNPLTEDEEFNAEDSSTEDNAPMEQKIIRAHLTANLGTLKFIQQCLADQLEGNSKCYIIKATDDMISVMEEDFYEVFKFESEEIAQYLNGRLAAAGFPKVYTDDMSDLQVDVLVIPANSSDDEPEVAHVHYEMSYLTDPENYDSRRKTIMDGTMNLNLVGIQYRDNYEELTETLEVGMKVVLKPEPTNEFDPNALAFYYNDEVIGYLPKKDQPFAHIFMAKGQIEATICNIDEQWIDTEVVITKDMIDFDAYEKNGVRFTKIESFRGGNRRSEHIELSDFVETL